MRWDLPVIAVPANPFPSAAVFRVANEMRAISLFSGAGGLDLGCESAGFQTVAVVESAERARGTMLANPERFPRLATEAVLDDVIDLDPSDLLDKAGLDSGEPDLLHGGPPCTPFSKSGYWLEHKRAGADPKASLLDEYVRLLDGVRPKALLMENVYGLAYRNQNRPMLERFLNGVRRAGYAVDTRVLLAADLGVPQMRQRLFCVGLRLDLLDLPTCELRFPWPTATHAGPHETRRVAKTELPAHVSVGAALEGLTEEVNTPEPEELVFGTYADALRGIPPGDNYLFWTEHRDHAQPRFKWRSRYWNFLLKLDPDRPSPTIQGQPGPWVGPFHWESRRLRVGEVKRLMTFPDDYQVNGTRREQQLQLGNAVPPQLARAVATAVADELGRVGAATTERQPALSEAA